MLCERQRLCSAFRTVRGKSNVVAMSGSPLPFPLLIVACCLALAALDVSAAEPSRPNIVLILADDLGYGDVHCNNPERGKIPTPNVDRLAAQGMRFTDAHTSSAVCSPTRYSLLTGRYHWRTRLQAGIVRYLEQPLIPADRLTLGGLMQKSGYRTAAIGKWHLGWDWSITAAQRPLVVPARRGDQPEVTEALRAAWKTIYEKPIGGGPTTRGFDEYFGTDVPNWPPYAFIQNDHTVGIPSEYLPAPLLEKNLASLPGPAIAGWKLENIPPALAERATGFITRSAKEAQPFFLYLPLTAPHTPIAVSAEWRGKSGLNAYADFVMETDDVVGRVLAALEASGVADRTLVLFTSDNGCAPNANPKELEAKGHFPSGPLRGYKADAWEGGHRVPFIVRWPGVVMPGARCDQLAHQVDLMATFAEVLGTTLPAYAGEDSVSLLPLLRGGETPVREYAISHSLNGVPSLRKRHWKIIFGPDGGGYTPSAAGATGGQLYDLATDLGETKNLWDERPEIVAELKIQMERLVTAHPNEIPTKWRRFLDPER